MIDADPARLLEQMRRDIGEGDVHLIGGPTMVETARSLGALDEVRLLVLPIFTGTGRRLTPELDVGTSLELQDVQSWPAGVVELHYSVRR